MLLLESLHCEPKPVFEGGEAEVAVLVPGHGGRFGEGKGGGVAFLGQTLYGSAPRELLQFFDTTKIQHSTSLVQLLIVIQLLLIIYYSIIIIIIYTFIYYSIIIYYYYYLYIYLLINYY